MPEVIDNTTELPPTFEDPDPVTQPLQCNVAVQDAMKKAWMVSSLGTSCYEYGFAVVQNADGTIGAMKPTSTHECDKDSFDKPTGALAIFHKHPNNTDPKPSSVDVATAEKYGIPVYTITGDGLWEYDPKTKTTVQLAKNLDWLKPCSP